MRDYGSLVDDPATALDPAQLEWHRKLHALRSLVELGGWDVDARPEAHPWVTFEPAARGILGLST